MQEKRTIIRKKINIYLLYYSVVMRERGSYYWHYGYMVAIYYILT